MKLIEFIGLIASIVTLVVVAIQFNFIDIVLIILITVIITIFVTAVVQFDIIKRLFNGPKIENPGLVNVRQKEILRLVNRIRTGQSSSISTFFSEERKAILDYLRNENPEQQKELYGDKANKLIFSYVDIVLDISKEISCPKFWEIALKPLAMKQNSELNRAYQICKDNEFNKISLENIITIINQQGLRLILLLDKFEVLLEYPNFKDNWEFFTTLRSLASLHGAHSPLALVIASNSSLITFNKKIQKINPSASPVLNFISETTVLGSLSDTDIDDLLEEHNLSANNRQLIKDMVGGHPYLLKIIVAEFNKISNQSDSVEITDICQNIESILENMLSSWPSKVREVFFMVGKQDDISNYKAELKELEMQGLISKNNNQWQIRSNIFLKCLKNISR
ncbi:AAA-like domain-containing protein [Thiotrichales bacterium HSG1]|nr:AAA-like domain-containing protein [Thiotrichales bacterium HSG1]